MKKIITLLCSAALAGSGAMSQRYVGGDISLLPEYEKAGAVYKDLSGKPIVQLLPWFKEEGMNAMRVRLFVNPDKYKEKHSGDADPDTRYDPNACQNLEYILPLCKRIVDSGFQLMLDFHYSDTWADPAKQWTPIDWEGLSDEDMYQKIYDYTKETLQTLKEAGATPAFIQPGNEISYGMLWGPAGTSDPKKALMGSDANWERFGNLLKMAIKACREECPQARIVIHTERVSEVDVTRNFYDKMNSLGIDYDIIGLSYYPYFHGDMNVLSKALNALQTRYPEKNIMIVETGYSYKWEVPGTSIDLSNVWPYSEAGQEKFVADLVKTLESYDRVNGLFWWWMEYNAFNTNLSGWYNAPLFDSTTGKATPALKTLCSFGDMNSADNIDEDESDRIFDENGQWYNLSGHRVRDLSVPGIYVGKGRKIVVK